MRSREERISAARRGYDRRWRKAAKAFLASNPLCIYCRRSGRTTAATVVDHVRPHRGDMKLFWDPGNWQPLCAPCHSAAKQREEHAGHTLGCGADGVPLDPGHHWHG